MKNISYRFKIYSFILSLCAILIAIIFRMVVAQEIFLSTILVFAGLLVLCVVISFRIGVSYHIDDLQAERAKDLAILDNIGEGLVVVDAKGEVVFLNRRTEELLGLKVRELVGKKWHDVTSLEDVSGSEIAEGDRPLSMALKRKERITADRYYFVRKNKTRFPVFITASPVVSDGIVGAVEIFRDISKEKELDRAKSGFISLASHQLRAPLSATKWLIELLMEGRLTNEQKENIKNLAISNERLINLVNDLLNISRLESATIVAKPQPTDIKSLIDGVLKLHKVKAEKDGKRLKFLFEDNIPTIWIDPVIFNEAFENILDNAISYSYDNSEIQIIVKTEGDECIISVHNEGVGIPAAERDKIFTRFYRSDGAKKIKPEGSGLGLAIAKSAVEASGGKIDFEISEGKGITFSIKLPIGR